MTEVRQYASEIEIRAGGDGRTIAGILVPYGEATRPDAGLPFVETFARGAFRRTVAERSDRIKVLVQHDSSRLAIGRSKLLREDTRGLYGELHVSQTQQGDEVLALARDGVVDAFSIGFSVPPGGDSYSTDRQVRTVTDAKLHEVSIVNEGAYAGAQILAVRTVFDPAADLDAYRRRLRLYELTN